MNLAKLKSNEVTARLSLERHNSMTCAMEAHQTTAKRTTMEVALGITPWYELKQEMSLIRKE